MPGDTRQTCQAMDVDFSGPSRELAMRPKGKSKVAVALRIFVSSPLIDHKFDVVLDMHVD